VFAVLVSNAAYLCASAGAKIQMLDLPGIIEGAKDGKGRGRQVISTARTCNLILIVLDCLKPLTHKKVRCG
jgi:ribosome-interacting GTPase 1